MGLARDPAYPLPGTQDEFERWCSHPDGPVDGQVEFLFGCVVAEPPARWPHGEIGATLVGRLAMFVRRAGCGRVFASSQGFALPSGDTVEPDVAVVLHATWAAGPAPVPDRFLRVVPDLVVEVLSPRTAARDRSVKRAIYQANGVREYWIVDRVRATITVLVLGDEARYTTAQVAAGDEPARSRVLDGFAVSPHDLIPPDAR